LIGASEPDRETVANQPNQLGAAMHAYHEAPEPGLKDELPESVRRGITAENPRSTQSDFNSLESIVIDNSQSTVGLTPEGNFTSGNFEPAFWIDEKNGNHHFMGDDASGVWRSGDYDVPIPDEPPLYYPPAEEWRRLADARQRINGINLDGDGNGVLDEDEVQFETRARDPSFNTEAYDRIVENRFQDVTQYPMSTFSIDVDTASYANVRRMLNSGRLPPPGAVRIEEFVNYFDYDYAPPDGTEPFAVRAEVAQCPWRPAHRLVRIGIKGRQLAVDERPASNLVFLLDVSGSMNDPAKLPLVKQGMRLLVERIEEHDRVAIVVYAGVSGLALDSTSGANKPRILAAIDQLQPGGSTNGAGGIELAYQIAEKHLIAGGVNRVILATDGDFNVGVTDQSQLVEMIEDRATGGVFLSVLGFGMGNLQDSTLEKLADHGNGNYAYIDTLREAKKVLVRQLDGTLVTIAKDVKIQLEFNPVKVAAYRLIGYENRMLAKEDFNDDTKDAGEIGAGHTVTALYEVVPTGEKTDVQTPAADDLEYQVKTHPTEAAKESPNLLTLKLRYKQPDGQESKLLRFPVEDADRGFAQADGDFQFASAVAAFGMLLRNSAYRGDANYDAVLEYATNGLAADEHGYRAEFVELVKASRDLSRRQTEDSASP
jgi:Ca-activated chloride channel family protein